MITKLKISNDLDKLKSIRIIECFEKKTKINLLDHLLIKISPCENFEFIHVFLNQENLDILVNIILQEEIIVFYKKDYTNKLTDIPKRFFTKKLAVECINNNSLQESTQKIKAQKKPAINWFPILLN